MQKILLLHDILKKSIPKIMTVIFRLSHPSIEFWITRKIILQATGLIYLCAFTPLIFQYQALLGEKWSTTCTRLSRTTPLLFSGQTYRLLENTYSLLARIFRPLCYDNYLSRSCSSFFGSHRFCKFFFHVLSVVLTTFNQPYRTNFLELWLGE